MMKTPTTNTPKTPVMGVFDLNALYWKDSYGVVPLLTPNYLFQLFCYVIRSSIGDAYYRYELLYEELDCGYYDFDKNEEMERYSEIQQGTINVFTDFVKDNALFIERQLYPLLYHHPEANLVIRPFNTYGAVHFSLVTYR